MDKQKLLSALRSKLKELPQDENEKIRGGFAPIGGGGISTLANNTKCKNDDTCDDNSASNGNTMCMNNSDCKNNTYNCWNNTKCKNNASDRCNRNYDCEKQGGTSPTKSNGNAIDFGTLL